MKVITLIVVAALLFITDLGYKKAVEYSKGNEFNITTIKLNGEYKTLKSDIIEPIISLKGKNIWYVDEKKIEENLSKDIRIKKVKIKKVFPDTISVDIEERKPYVYIVIDGRLYVSDEKGLVYGYEQEYKAGEIPVVYLFDKKQKTDVFEAVSKISTSVLKDYVAYIYNEGEVINTVLKDGVIFKSDKNSDKEKYNTGAALYLNRKSENLKTTYIDIRFKDCLAK
jgi:cell division protein FtsQ